ncbi:MAG: PhoX family protein [Actinomycetota bacterium]|nr:PhoX family protein [Actinomycetota bacterium]
MDRRAFLQRGAAVSGGLALAGPLQAFAMRSASGATTEADGYGKLINMGALALPEGFTYRTISSTGRLMTDGNPTPTAFDGMAAFPGGNGNSILIRNHENRKSTGDTDETDVEVPAELRYDPDPMFNGGNTKLIVDRERRLVRDFAVLGGTSTNCAGGAMPWGSWVTCEEVFQDGEKPHGYIFEVPAYTKGPVEAVPVKAAGRFVHEAVAWHGGVLYQTEDQRYDAGFYRYVPDQPPGRDRSLASTTGKLEALSLVDVEDANTDGFPVGEAFVVAWVPIEDPDPTTDTVRDQAHDLAAAGFNRPEGAWTGGGKVYFDCTEGGVAGLGQIWEYDPGKETLTLIYESPGPEELKNPDNLVVGPGGVLFLCEDSEPPQYVRALTPDGRIFDFARGNKNETEFAGATFDPTGRILFVNQQGDEEEGIPGVTYAISGPWTGAR